MKNIRAEARSATAYSTPLYFEFSRNAVAKSASLASVNRSLALYRRSSAANSEKVFRLRMSGYDFVEINVRPLTRIASHSRFSCSTLIPGLAASKRLFRSAQYAGINGVQLGVITLIVTVFACAGAAATSAPAANANEAATATLRFISFFIKLFPPRIPPCGGLGDTSSLNAPYGQVRFVLIW